MPYGKRALTEEQVAQQKEHAGDKIVRIVEKRMTSDPCLFCQRLNCRSSYCEYRIGQMTQRPQ